MKIDKINNSQLILLVLLITVVTSAAISVATLSLIYKRLPIQKQTEYEPTVIKQTINRIIEREPAQTEKNVEIKKSLLTLEEIQKSFVLVYFGSQSITSGVFINSKGHILVPKILKENRIYNLFEGEEQTQFNPIYIGRKYTVLNPITEYVPSAFIELAKDETNISLGQTSFIYGGFNYGLKIHSEIISQKRITDGITTIKTSANTVDISLPSAIFLNNKLIGFITESDGWLEVFTSEYLEKE